MPSPGSAPTSASSSAAPGPCCCTRCGRTPPSPPNRAPLVRCIAIPHIYLRLVISCAERGCLWWRRRGPAVLGRVRLRGARDRHLRPRTHRPAAGVAAAAAGAPAAGPAAPPLGVDRGRARGLGGGGGGGTLRAVPLASRRGGTHRRGYPPFPLPPCPSVPTMRATLTPFSTLPIACRWYLGAGRVGGDAGGDGRCGLPGPHVPHPAPGAPRALLVVRRHRHRAAVAGPGTHGYRISQFLDTAELPQ